MPKGEGTKTSTAAPATTKQRASSNQQHLQRAQTTSTSNKQVGMASKEGSINNEDNTNNNLQGAPGGNDNNNNNNNNNNRNATNNADLAQQQPPTLNKRSASVASSSYAVASGQGPPPPLPPSRTSTAAAAAAPPQPLQNPAAGRRAPPPPPLSLRAASSAAAAGPPVLSTKTRQQQKTTTTTTIGTNKTPQQQVGKKKSAANLAQSSSTRRLADDFDTDSIGSATEAGGGGGGGSGAGGPIVADFALCDSSSLASSAGLDGTGAPSRNNPSNIGTALTDGSGAGPFGDDHQEDEEAGPAASSATCSRETIRKLLTKNLIWAVFASAVGSSFQHGYNGGVVNAPEKLIGEFINETYWHRYKVYATETQVDFIVALIVAIFCIGGCAGALLTACVADRLGRKEGLMWNNLLVLLAAPLMASSRSMASYELLIAGRFLIGINAGLNAGLAPLYLNEIAPTQLRGALGTIYQLVITISILLSNIFGLPNLLGDHDSWPILFALPIVPAAFMLVALPHCCESPKHLLLNQGKELQAQQALAWLRQTGDVQEEMDELRGERELQIMMNNRSISLANMLSETSLRRPLTIAIVIMLSQQLSGINAVLFFSTSIFRDAGLSEHGAIQATLGMSLVNVAMTLVSLFLVDRAGRRTLHMTGLMGMAATCLVLALCLNSTGTYSSTTATDAATANHAPLASSLAVIAVYVFIAMFASGPGAIPWFLVAELFPSNARPLASSIAVSVNWLANFTVSLSFLPLTNLLHGFTFVLFAILLVLFYLFTYYRVPETKGATAEEISALFRAR